MADPSGAPGEPTPLPEGTLTVLFTDVEGSTDMRTREGDDFATEVMRVHEVLVRAEVTTHGGHEAGFMGDGFMVVFPSTRKALDCSIAIQRSFEEHNRTTSGHPIRVRMGLNCGEVLREGQQFYGTPINAAARISGKASGGQILVSQVVRDVLAGVRELAFVDRGLHTLKGFPSQWRLFEVPWAEDGGAQTTEPAERATEPALRARPAAAGAMDETYPRPARGPLVGRMTERDAIDEGLDAARAGQIRAVALEGEAGIGKTRLMEAAVEAAAERGFGAVMVAADEELRGPFFLLRTVLASTSLESLADRAVARDALEAARDAVWGRGADETGLTPAEQLLRIYDVTTVALRRIAEAQPLALLFDDVQWADEDSLKLIRYLVRTSPGTPIFLMLAQRPDAGPAAGVATNLVADLERLHVARRLPVLRLSLEETRELLQQVCSMPASPECAAVLHERGEGVPFFIVEFAQAFRDAALFHVIDGQLEVSAAARSTVPTSVQILIERRLAQLPGDTREALGDAAVAGRRFRLDTLARVMSQVTASATTPVALLSLLDPAVEHSLVNELPEGAAHDYTFTHDEIRTALVTTLPRGRRRAVHAALLEILAEEGESPATLPALAFHALEAGDAERGVGYSIAAARAALEAFAPEAALRAVDAARSAAGAPAQRAHLLRLRDDALDALERPDERLATLTEMAALASALGDDALDREIRLRRASALRLAGDHEQAAELARAVQDDAAAREDAETELRACLELGQALMRSPLGETFSPAVSEVDIEGIILVFERAAALAAETGNERVLAAVKRELGVAQTGRVQAFVLSMLEMHPEIASDPEADPREIPPIKEGLDAAAALIGEALAIYERLHDRRGTMSSLIALACSMIDITSAGHAGRLEQIRRLIGNLDRLTSETERAESRVHMLYSIHVYARGHGPPDIALKRGYETLEAARDLPEAQGGHFSFLAAGGLALVHGVQLGDLEQATAWMDRAAASALTTQRFLPTRLIETWRGLIRAAAGDAQGARAHLERALAAAVERGSPAGRCELLAIIAQESARLGADAADQELLSLAEARAVEALDLASSLPTSDAPWSAMAHAALAQVAFARGEQAAAHERSLTAVAELGRIRQLNSYVYPELWLLIVRTLPDGDERADLFRNLCAHDLSGVAQQTRDDLVRSRWLTRPVVAELLERVGSAESIWHLTDLPAGIGEREVDLLRRLLSGETNDEIAASMGGRNSGEIARELEAVFAKIGAGDRDQAAAAAVRRGIA